MSRVRRAATDSLDGIAPALTEILLDCVHAGASVGFVLPFEEADASAFWRDRVFPGVSAENTDLFIAEEQSKIIGTVLLNRDMMPNQAHRADLAKLLVHSRARRRGAGKALVEAAETRARELGKSLLVLDTRSGDPAQALYTERGFQIAGTIPDFCRNPFKSELEPTTYMFKTLA